MTTTLVRNPVTSVRYIAGAWLVVMALTLLSWSFSNDHALGALGVNAIDTAILLVTFAKMFVIAHAFMEQRHAARWLRPSFAGWYVLVCAALMALYWM
jgi:uncharacterized membrane protein